MDSFIRQTSRVIKNESIRPWDVDDTLVLHNPSKSTPKVDILDPQSNIFVSLGIHSAMVKLLKEEFSRGSYIIVWSRGGFAWAKAVVDALELNSYVHLIMTKPLVYYDDKDVDTWMKDRVYLEPGTNYKNTTKKTRSKNGLRKSNRSKHRYRP